MPRRTSDHTNARTTSALAGLPLFNRGAQTNNMAPSKSQIQNLTPVIILQQGIDTLIFSVYGTLREDVALCLEMAKEDAQQSPIGQALAPLPTFAGVTPLMQASGAKFFEWRALSQDVTVVIAKPSRSRRPKAQIRLSSECLWRLGGGGLVAAEIAEHYLRPLFEEDGYRVQVSQVHMATDFQGHSLCLDDMRGLVKRPRNIDSVSQYDGVLTWRGGGDVLDSIAAGRSNAIRISLYDKTKEMGVHGKEWFTALWERHAGYKEGAQVMRLEYQFGREVLHDRRIDTLAQLVAAMPGLWAYGVKWFSFRTPSQTDSRVSRWPVADWWAALSTWGKSDAPPLPKVKQVRPKFERICEGGFGYFTSIMALMDSQDPSEALSLLMQVIRSKKGEAGMDAALLAKRLRYGGFTMADA